MTHPFYFTWSRQSDAPAFDVERAAGCHYIAPGGRRFLDLVSTSFQASFGLSFKPVLDAMRAQLVTMPVTSPKAVFPLKDRVTKRLIDFINIGGGKIFYTLSGAEAIENALKMAREISGKKIVVSCADSYHGATLGALSVSGDWRRDAHCTMDEWNIRIPSPADDPDFTEAKTRLEKAGPQHVAALCFETVSGTNGVITGGETWWREMENFRRQHCLFLILDEVLCGFYRTAIPFAWHARGVTPDFICLAKAMTGGYFPLGAVWTSSAVADFYDRRILSCGLTNYAHPVGLAALEAVLDTLEDNAFVAKIGDLEKVFARELEKFKAVTAVKAIRRQGLLACLDLDKTVPVKAFLKRDLYVTVTEKRLFFAPAFVMVPEELQHGLATACAVLQEDST